MEVEDAFKLLDPEKLSHLETICMSIMLKDGIGDECTQCKELNDVIEYHLEVIEKLLEILNSKMQ
jgi:hypothetical protein